MKKLLLALLLPFSANALDPARLNSTFILAPTSTLQASAGTASVISCTVSVAALQGTVDTPTAVTPTFLSSSVTPLYTSAAGVTSLISSIACANTSGSVVTNVKFYTAGSGTVNQVLVLDTFPAHGSLTYTDTGWRVLDGTGALITSSSGAITSLIGGTGINITGGNVINMSNQIAAGGPTGSATVAPILTYNAQGQLTAVGSATITPPFSALTGSAACSQLPALTGDTTTTAGTCATSTTKTGGVAFGTLATLNAAPAGTLTGATLAAGVTGSSLTSVGILGALTVTAPIAGSVTGSAASLSTVLDCTKFPALSGAITTPAGSCVTTASAIPTTSLTGALQAAQEPAHTGDMTNTAGSLATTVSKFNGGTPLASAAGKTTGISVDDPGTGALEYLIKPQTIVTGASKAWAASDYYKSQKRSNSGSAMSDTLPCGTANGQSMLLNNVDVSATDTLTVSGCTFTSATGIAGGTTFGLNFARRSRFVWNAGTSSWDIEVNSNNVVKTISPVTVGNLPIFSTYTSGIELSPFTGTGYVKATGGGPITAAATVPSADLAITPTTCTNQFVTAISAGGLGTCTTDTLASAQHANQGTTTTVLHGNAAGNPSFSAVSDGDFSGQLSVAHGGTGQAALSSVSLSAFGAPTGTLSMGTQFVSNVKDAVNPLDAVNLETLQVATNSVDSRDSAVYATATALPANTYNNGSSGVGATLTATANGPLTVDTQLVVSGQRILVKNESAPANNGIYTVTQPGVVAVSPYILTRTLDFNASAEIFTGILIPVQSGTVSPGAANNNQIFVSAAASPFTVGTTAVNFSAIASTYTAGTGLTLTGTQFSITPTITGGGPTGSASVVPVITWNAQGQLTAVSTAAITPAAIGAPSGSGNSTGTNTGDITLTASGTSANANGATLTGQQIQLQQASSSFAGLMSAANSAFLTAYKDKAVVLVTANQYSSIACDGTTDDAAAWNALTAAAPADSVLLMPTCTSIIKSAITTAKHFAFKGNGQGRSIIRSTVNAADFLTLGDWYSTVEGIQFDGLNTTVTSAVALSGAGISLLVGSTAGFPASGSFYVQTNLGWTLAAYTSIGDATHFAGTTAAASTTVAGGPITVKTAGFAVNGQAMNHVFVKDIWFNYVFNGFRTDGTICGILDSQIFGEVNFGIQMNGASVNDIIHNVTADGIPPAVAHLEVNQAGSLLLSDNDLIRAQSDMRLNPTSPNGVFGVYVVNTYFDTATGVSGTANSGNGVLIQGTGNVQRIKIINSWMSSATHDGLWANSTAATLPTDIELSGNNIYSNGANGLEYTTVQDTIVSGNQISGNVTAGINLTAGTGGVTNGSILNNQIGPAGGIGANGTGILVNAGTYGNLQVAYNDLSGNTTASQSGLPATVTAPNMEILAGNTGLFVCPPAQAPATVLPLTTVTEAGTSCTMRPGARVGSWARITATLTHLATSTAVLTPSIHYGTANSSADASLLIPTALGAGTAVAGTCQVIWEFDVVSATTANVTFRWVNGNAATGCSTTASTQSAATAPVAVTNINTQAFLGAYFACSVASCATVQEVKYEYGQ